MVFETRKLQNETLSEYLVAVRESLGFTTEEVASRLGMKHKVLLSLETGDYVSLPPDVYVTGLLKKIGTLYSIEPDVIIQQYRKERNIASQHIDTDNRGRYQISALFQKVTVTPRLLTVSVAGLFIAIAIIYIIWQVFSINQQPSLEIFEPKDRQVIKESSVMVFGRTDPGMTVTINDQSVFVDSDGNFRTQLGISPGPKDLVFVARNKFDKFVTARVSVVGEIGAVSDANVTLLVQATSPIQVSYEIDNATSVSERIEAGDSKELKARQQIRFSTSDGGATKIVLNNQDLGFLGRPGEPLEGIPFSVESDSMK
jgi:cytoskeletal protein RodZ